jgi:hypothetical protein
MYKVINSTTNKMRSLNSREIRRAMKKKNKNIENSNIFNHRFSDIMKDQFNTLNKIKQVY